MLSNTFSLVKDLLEVIFKTMASSSASQEEFNPSEAYLRRLRNIIDDSSDEDINESFSRNTANLGTHFLSIADDTVDDSSDYDAPQPSRRRLDEEELKNEETIHRGKDIDVIIKRQNHKQERKFGLMVSSNLAQK